MNPVDTLSIGLWPDEVPNSRYTALEDADEHEGDLIQAKDRDSAKDDIALPMLADPVEVKGDRKLDENLVHDEHDTATDCELYRWSAP